MELTMLIVFDTFVGLLSMVIGLLSVVVTPFAVFFARRLNGLDTIEGNDAVKGPWKVIVPRFKLPSWAAWLETPDDRGGLLPAGMYEEKIRLIYQDRGWYRAAVRWLWRNRAYRLSQKLRPFELADALYALVVVGSKDLDEDSKSPTPTGWAIYAIYNHDKLPLAGELYVVWRYLKTNRALKIRFGVTAQPFVRNAPNVWPRDDKTAWGQPRFSINPIYKVS